MTENTTTELEAKRREFMRDVIAHAHKTAKAAGLELGEAMLCLAQAGLMMGLEISMPGLEKTVINSVVASCSARRDHLLTFLDSPAGKAAIAEKARDHGVPLTPVA